MTHDEEIQRYLADEMTTQEKKELFARLTQDPDALEEFVEHRQLDLALRALLNKQGITAAKDAVLSDIEAGDNRPMTRSVLSEILEERARQKRVPVLRILLAAAALIIVGLVSYAWYSRPRIDMERIGKIAKVTRKVDPVSANNVEYTVDEYVPSDTVDLKSGELELTLDSGAVLLLKGRTNIRFIHSRRLMLNRGELLVHVAPNGWSLKVDTPTATIDDIGTTFGIVVNNDKTSDIHVLHGMVDVTRKGAKVDDVPVRLNAARSLHVDGEQASSVDFRADLFASWSPSRTKLPDCDYVHWKFESFADGEFADHGRSAGGRSFPLHIKKYIPERVKPKGKKKKWKSSALTHVDLVPGIHGKALRLHGRSFGESEAEGVGENRSRTIAFWVRFDPSNTSHAPMGLVAWGSHGPGRKWQVTCNSTKGGRGADAGGVGGAVRTEAEKGFIIGSTDLRDGEWHHVASVFHGGEGANVATHVRIYVDGRLEGISSASSREVFTGSGEESRVRVGKHFNVNPGLLKGDIDEVYIFEAALTPMQIQQLSRRPDNKRESETP